MREDKFIKALELVSAAREAERTELLEVLKMARQQIKTLGTPDDEINNNILAIIDRALTPKWRRDLGPGLGQEPTSQRRPRRRFKA